MYRFKRGKLVEIKRRYKIEFLAEKVGVSRQTLSSVINGRYSCTKPLAFCITKMINSEAEIADYFDKI